MALTGTQKSLTHDFGRGVNLGTSGKLTLKDFSSGGDESSGEKTTHSHTQCKKTTTSQRKGTLGERGWGDEGRDDEAPTVHSQKVHFFVSFK